MSEVLATRIISVKTVIEKIFPPNLVLTATCNVPTGGYSNPRLEPVIYVRFPDDGIWEFHFSLEEPISPATDVITEMEATYVWDDYPAELKGIKIYGKENYVIFMI